jgi:hypothetical protein
MLDETRDDRSSPYFSAEHEMLRAQVQRFVETEIKPHAQAWESAGFVPREVLRRMGELGFLGIRYSEKYGGSEMGALGSVVLAEELGRSTFGGVAITVLVHTDMASVHIYNSDAQAIKDRFMPDIIAGKKIVAVAVTEPGAGSDVKSIRTTARRNGSEYLLNGRKMFITNGVHADLYCVAAKTGVDSRASQNISMFLVEKGTPGFHVGKKLEKHGWRSSDTAELSFEDCRVPAANLLGAEGRGFYAIVHNFQNERIVMGAMAMGEAQAAIDLTLDSCLRFSTLVQANDPSSPGDACRQGRGRKATCFPHGLVDGARNRRDQRSFDGEGLLWRARQRSHVCVRAVSRRHGLHAGERDRAHGKGCACAHNRGRRDRNHARRDCQAHAFGFGRPEVKILRLSA